MTDRYYCIDEEKKILYHSTEEGILEDPELIYRATSNCPNPKLVFAHMLKNEKVNTGFRVVNYDVHPST